jgi:hypothetical protein
MTKEKDCFDSSNNSNVEFKNDFEAMAINNDNVVFDYATNLMWRGTVISSFFNFGGKSRKTVSHWIKKKTIKPYALVKNWRLPTIEEAASLLKMSKNSINNLHITPKFPYAKIIITGDYDSKSNARWIVNFELGRVKIWEGSDGDSIGVFFVHPLQ